MAGLLSKRLSAGEISGYFVFLLGFATLAFRGGFQDPWIEAAVLVMALGAVIAGRTGGGR
jgi:hypothetical protein